ncbi:MAG: hypothetical protein ACAH83_05975 [Alphaproteobacteria bacterium]
MTKKQTARKAAQKAIDQFDISGRWANDFVEQMFGALPLSKATKLTGEFAKVLKADDDEARRKGKAFEEGLPGNPDPDKHFKASTASNARDKKFAAALPASLRRKFYAVVKDAKEYDYHCGQGDVRHKRNMARLDEILADPVQAGAFYQRTMENAHLRDPIMFPRFTSSVGSDW